MLSRVLMTETILSGVDWRLFLSTFALIFVAELPDKTAFATLVLATRKNPKAIFIGVAAAFTVQSLVAVSFGSVISLLPRNFVEIGAALMFLVFAILAWRRKEEETDEGPAQGPGETFGRATWSSFLVIFIAEWGDLTQLATATLQAQHRSPLTIFLSATLALWAVTALAIGVGSHAKKFIQPVLLTRISAFAFAGVGVVLLGKALLKGGGHV